MSDSVAFTESPPRSIASITVFRDVQKVRSLLEEEFGAAPPTTPSFLRAGEVTLSCLAPTRFVASGPRDANLAERLAKSLENQAAITDQSDLWFCVALRLTAGPEKLAQLVPIDLAPEKFPIGALALTRAGHFNIRLWHVAEKTYELAVPRSYASDLRHALA